MALVRLGFMSILLPRGLLDFFEFKGDFSESHVIVKKICPTKNRQDSFFALSS